MAKMKAPPVRATTWRELMVLAWPGLLNMLSIIVQGMGLQYVSASVSQMISGFFPVFWLMLMQWLAFLPIGSGRSYFLICSAQRDLKIHSVVCQAAASCSQAVLSVIVLRRRLNWLHCTGAPTSITSSALPTRCTTCSCAVPITGCRLSPNLLSVRDAEQTAPVLHTEMGMIGGAWGTGQHVCSPAQAFA